MRLGEGRFNAKYYACAFLLENQCERAHCNKSFSAGSAMANVRNPAVAGLFYPDDPRELRALIAEYLAAVPTSGVVPKAIIAPHAGYI